MRVRDKHTLSILIKKRSPAFLRINRVYFFPVISVRPRAPDSDGTTLTEDGFPQLSTRDHQIIHSFVSSLLLLLLVLVPENSSSSSLFMTRVSVSDS